MSLCYPEYLLNSESGSVGQVSWFRIMSSSRYYAIGVSFLEWPSEKLCWSLLRKL